MTEQEANDEELSDSSYTTVHSSDSENEGNLRCSEIDNGQKKKAPTKCNKNLKKYDDFDLFTKQNRTDFLNELKEAIAKLSSKRDITLTPITNMNKIPSLDKIMPTGPAKPFQSEDKVISTEVNNSTKKKDIGTLKSNTAINTKSESIFHKGSKQNAIKNPERKILPTVLSKKKQASPSPNRKNIDRKKHVDMKMNEIKDSTAKSFVIPKKNSKKPASKKTPPSKKNSKKKTGENSGMTKLKSKPRSVDVAGNSLKEKKSISPKRVSFQPDMVEVVSYVEETSKDSLTPDPLQEETTNIVSENSLRRKARPEPVSMTPERAAKIKNFYKSVAKKTRNEHIKHEKHFLALKKSEFSNDFN